MPTSIRLAHNVKLQAAKSDTVLQTAFHQWYIYLWGQNSKIIINYVFG